VQKRLQATNQQSESLNTKQIFYYTCFVTVFLTGRHNEISDYQILYVRMPVL